MLRKILHSATLATLLLGLAAHAQSQQATEDQAKSNVGKPAPELAVTEWLTDKSITQEELAGKPYVLEFWATWCPPCRTSIPHLNTISQQLEPFGLKIIGLTNEAADVAKPFVQNMAMLYYVASDDSTSEGLVFSGIPFAAVVDAKGTVVWAGHPMDPEFEAAAVEQIQQSIPETMKSALQKALQNEMPAAYAELAGMDTDKARAAVRIIDANIDASVAQADKLEGIDKFNALSAINEFYGATAAAESIPAQLETLGQSPEIQAALEEQKILQGLETKVMVLQEEAMKTLQAGGDEQAAAVAYLSKLIPILEDFTKDNPDHTEAKQISQMLPMMKQELQRLSKTDEEPAEAAETEPDAAE